MAVKCYFIGYLEGIKGYKLWSIDGNPSRAFISRDVVFNEEALLESKVVTKISSSDSDVEQNSELKVESIAKRKSSEMKNQGEQKQAELEGYQLARDRERRVIKMPKKYGIADLISYALMVAEDVNRAEPTSFQEAMSSKRGSKWLAAMKEEIASFKKNDTWILVDRPANKKLVGCNKWVFKLKEGATSAEQPRFKARLVAKGFTQRAVMDFNEVFSPVVKHSSIKILLAITTALDLELDQMDVKITFLHGNLNKEFLMS